MVVELRKRAFDVILSSLVLALSAPVMLLCAAAIRLTSRGPVFFRQVRLGLHGKEFTMLKFRTMLRNSEFEGDGLYSFNGDPRVTWVGALLRKASLDELPQLLNVVSGSMSIVGPRPAVTYEIGPYETYTPPMRRRLEVRPGITGLAQVSGRNELDWDSKLELDLQYIELFRESGIKIDLQIIFRTVSVVLGGRQVNEIPNADSAGPIANRARRAGRLEEPHD